MTPERWQKIEEVFQAVVDLAPTERLAYLTKNHTDDEELIAEINKLISDYDEAGDFIESPVWTDSFMLGETIRDQIGGSIDSEIKQDNGSMIGKRLGVYLLTKELGRGGMGAVYLAERADGEFRQRVALKVIKRGMDTDFIVRRFRNERQILASLNHPNIARLLDGGTTSDGLPYFVMEYIEGEPVYHYADSQKLNINERLQLFRRICAAVDHAHRRQIIHRDIKPSNIMITANGMPKLLDFGIAKILDPELAADSIDPTATAMRMMTPEYASPEQVRGEAVTKASDIYSLGVLLYELLTGHRPYRLKNRALHEIARVVCEEQPESLSASLTREDNIVSTKESEDFTPLEFIFENRNADLEALRRELSGDLEKIVLKAMRKKTEERYHSAEEFAADILRYLENRPVIAGDFDTDSIKSEKTAPKDSSDEIHTSHVATRILPAVETTASVEAKNPTSETKDFAPETTKKPRRNLLAYAITGAVLLMIVSVFFFKSMTKTDGNESVSQKENSVVSNPASVSKQKKIAVLPFKTDSQGGKEEQLGSGLAESLYRKLGQIKELSVSPAMINLPREQTPKELGASFGVSYILRGTLHNTGNQLQVSAELIDTTTEKILWAETFDETLDDLPNLQISISDKVLKALTIELTSADQRKINKSYTTNTEAYQLYLGGRYLMKTRSADNIHKAIELFTKSREKDSNYALAYSGLADAYALLNLYEIPPPEDAYSKAKENALKALQIDENLAEAHASLGYILFYGEQKRTEAEAEFHRALELNPSYSTVYHWSGLAYAAMGKTAESIANINKAMELEPRSAIVHSAAGLVYFYARRYDEALTFTRKSLEIDNGFVPAHKTMRVIYEAVGNYDEAQNAYQKERLFAGNSDENEPGWLMITAQVQATGGKRDEALANLKKVSASNFVKNNPKAYAYEVAIAYALLSENDDAISWLEKSAAANAQGFNFAKVDSRLEKIKDDPRFRKIVKVWE
jgi:serine/threonine protein kinase/tetratricopeptide (TPR) repeat protein